MNSSEGLGISNLSVVDGDTVVAYDKDGKKMRIRLFGIDAPEKDQEFGDSAKYFLIEQLERTRPIKVVLEELEDEHREGYKNYKKDKYHRYIGTLIGTNQSTGEDVNINQKMVESGFAWAYPEYIPDFQTQTIYISLQDYARSNHKGLWINPNPQNPHDYRVEHHIGYYRHSQHPKRSKHSKQNIYPKRVGDQIIQLPLRSQLLADAAVDLCVLNGELIGDDIIIDEGERGADVRFKYQKPYCSCIIN